MTAHHTISAVMIRDAAQISGAHELHVKRAVLGLPVEPALRERIVAALEACGMDRSFLDRLAGGSQPPPDTEAGRQARASGASTEQ